jgi:hypothetical protein
MVALEVNTTQGSKVMTNKSKIDIIKDDETTKSTQMPKRYMKHLLKDMPVNSRAYAVPWAMEVVGPKRKCFLDLQHGMNLRSGGTCDLVVWRSASGFSVGIQSSSTWFSWRKRSKAGEHSVAIERLVTKEMTGTGE